MLALELVLLLAAGAALCGVKHRRAGLFIPLIAMQVSVLSCRARKARGGEFSSSASNQFNFQELDLLLFPVQVAHLLLCAVLVVLMLVARVVSAEHVPFDFLEKDPQPVWWILVGLIGFFAFGYWLWLTVPTRRWAALEQQKQRQRGRGPQQQDAVLLTSTIQTTATVARASRNNSEGEEEKLVKKPPSAKGEEVEKPTSSSSNGNNELLRPD